MTFTRKPVVMFALVPDSVLFSLFDTSDELAEYLVADESAQQRKAQELLEKNAMKGTHIPGLSCDIKFR